MGNSKLKKFIERIDAEAKELGLTVLVLGQDLKGDEKEEDGETLPSYSFWDMFMWLMRKDADHVNFVGCNEYVPSKLFDLDNDISVVVGPMYRDGGFICRIIDVSSGTRGDKLPSIAFEGYAKKSEEDSSFNFKIITHLGSVLEIDNDPCISWNTSVDDPKLIKALRESSEEDYLIYRKFIEFGERYI